MLCGFLPGMDNWGIWLKMTSYWAAARARGVVFVEVFEFGVEHYCLERVEAGVDAEGVVVVLFRLAVVGDHADAGGEVVVVGHEGATVAVAAEVFGGEEGGAADMAEGT